jgi:hypothetical protein
MAFMETGKLRPEIGKRGMRDGRKKAQKGAKGAG